MSEPIPANRSAAAVSASGRGLQEATQGSVWNLTMKAMQEKREYTTGEIAELLNTSQTTVIRWFESGLLKGHTMPGGTHRRIPHSRLVEFINEHGLPNPFDSSEA